MLSKQLTSNSLFHDDEEAKKHREQIYVPLALVERKKSEKREQDQLSPEQGTKLYEPQYEEKQRFAHHTFLENILRQKQGKTQGKRIALIGEPGAGKTTLLQTIGNWVLQQGLGLPVWVSLADLTESGNLRNLRDYLLEYWLSFAVTSSSQRVRENFTEQFEEKRVWLLLDGVDEIATSSSQTLQNISRQLSGWVGKARVVLTCRLNVWQADVNALSEFETFRLLDFDYPQQVHQFIDNWFGNTASSYTSLPSHTSHTSPSSRLKEELGKEEKARVRDLVQNPLRLALLCRSWQLYEGSLPETKAELYGQFVEQFYRWNIDRFPIEKSKRRKLNLALGSLAKDDIDSSGSRFRLRQDFIEKRLGDADDENSLFYLALQIGWLNNVGVAAESPMKKVYAFFHATFEEYFAALVIDDWDFFLPRKHKNKPVKGRRYRIFEPQWKQVILLWLGREDVGEEKKEEFIKALTEFKDGCHNFLTITVIVGRGFYEYRAYFLAAAGTAEFRKCTQTDKIVKKVVDWVYDSGMIKTEAHALLLETPRKNTINALVQLLGSASDNYIPRQAAESLGKIDPSNQKAINALLLLLGATVNNWTRTQAAESLGKIDPGNQKAIDALVHLLKSTSDAQTRRQAAETLGKIGTGNQKAIDALVHLLKSTSDAQTRRQAAESLGKIGTGNQKAIDVLVHLLESTPNYYTCILAAASLGQIDPGNERAIDALVHLLEWSTPNYYTRILAAESLGKIGTGNQKAIDALVHLLRSTSDAQTRRQAAESLDKIGTGNQKAIDALVHLLKSTPDYYTRILAAESLGQIDRGNEKAINDLVQLLESTPDYYTRRQAAESLGKISTGNQKAINVLVHLLRSTSNYYTRILAAVSLGKIGTGNQKAINSLVQLLESNPNYYTRRQAAVILGKIDPGNEKAIDSLVQLLESTTDDMTRKLAAASLGKILAQKQMAEVVTSLKDYLSEKGYRDNRDSFKECYKIIWKCAQTLPYPKFYQAWHHSSKSKKTR